MTNGLPNGFEYCRKGLYEVQIELGCLKISDPSELPDGFECAEIEGELYAVKSGTNILEQNSWTTSPNKPYIITGTVGERWPVKESNLSAYDVDKANIGITPITVSTKNPSNQEFMVAVRIPVNESATVIPSWAFKEDGTIDDSQVMIANDKKSAISHLDGDYVVAKHIDGLPEFWQLSDSEKSNPKIIEMYDPRIINGSIMETTYDHDIVKENIEAKYNQNSRKVGL